MASTLQRRIIKLGTATMVASLPSRWIKANNLKPGDIITLEEKGSEITLSTKKELGPKTSKIRIRSSKDFMGRLIHTPYRFGYDRLEIRFDDPQVMLLIRRFLDQCLGFEITDQTEGSVTIEMVAKNMEGEFDKLLRRSMLIIQGMLDDLTRAIGKNDHSLLDDICQREDTVDKLTHFCIRVLNTRVYEPGRSNYTSLVVASLERVADDLGAIAGWAKSASKKDRSSALKAIEAASRSFADFTSFFQKPSQESALRARNAVRIAKKLQVLDPAMAGPLYSTLESIDDMIQFFESSLE